MLIPVHLLASFKALEPVFWHVLATYKNLLLFIFYFVLFWVVHLSVLYSLFFGWFLLLCSVCMHYYGTIYVCVLGTLFYTFMYLFIYLYLKTTWHRNVERRTLVVQ